MAKSIYERLSEGYQRDAERIELLAKESRTVSEEQGVVTAEMGDKVSPATRKAWDALETRKARAAARQHNKAVIQAGLTPAKLAEIVPAEMLEAIPD